MAQKRMFDKTVTKCDNFMEMPDSTQNLYFHLSMEADDDGFVDNWKSIMRMIGKKEDDLKLLIAKQFILPFESGVIVIKHWRINNYLRKDRYNETKYLKEKKELFIEENQEYSFKKDLGIPVGNPEENSIEENSIEENSIVYKSLHEIVEENFGRTLSPIEAEEISTWEDNDLTKYAIKQTILKGICNIKYISAILADYRRNNIQTVQQAIEKDEKFKNKNKNTYAYSEPEWLGKTIEKNEASEEELKEMQELLKEYGK